MLEDPAVADDCWEGGRVRRRSCADRTDQIRPLALSLPPSLLCSPCLWPHPAARGLEPWERAQTGLSARAGYQGARRGKQDWAEAELRNGPTKDSAPTQGSSERGWPSRAVSVGGQAGSHTPVRSVSGRSWHPKPGPDLGGGVFLPLRPSPKRDYLLSVLSGPGEVSPLSQGGSGQHSPGPPSQPPPSERTSDDQLST